MVILRRLKKDVKREVWKWGLLGGFGEAVYILLVSLFLRIMENTFPVISRPFWGFLFFITLLVFSAAVSGLLVLARPLMLTFKKDYKEAILTLAISLGVLFLMLIIVILLAVM